MRLSAEKPPSKDYKSVGGATATKPINRDLGHMVGGSAKRGGARTTDTGTPKPAHGLSKKFGVAD